MKDKVVFITGAKGGLGSFVTRRFLETGATVIGTSRSISQQDFPQPNFTALFALDVTDESAAESAVKAAIGAFGSLEVVINNAGYGNLSSVEDTPMSDFRAQIENESLRDDHRDEGRSSVLSPKESRSFCSVFVDGRQDRASRAWALFGCEMACRGFLRSVVARSGAARHQGHHR